MGCHTLLQVDAFTDRPLEGNPCAVVFDADSLTDKTMLRVAREMNLSETAFVLRSTRADFGARYFTPSEEIPPAGHPTVATVFGLVETGRLRLAGDDTAVTLELCDGPIRVDIRAQQGVVREVVMTQRRPRFLATYDAPEVLPVFGLTPDDLLPGTPVQTVSTGTPQLMIALRDLDRLRRVRPDIAAYERLRSRADFFSPHLFCLEGATPAGRTFARHFGAPPDVLEDPFTGSATGGMAVYLWRYGLIDEPRFRAEQGHWMGRPGIAAVEVLGSREDPESVRVGGSAVTVVRGELVVPGGS
ncbi:MAG: PhzF family phenazine biosynthesis protein [Chloroflexota bacterium]|nr:PhzF family phenazine biosynthesis protein [Chloroflexota bacterium]